MSDTQSDQVEYRVLARKYRPQNFDELIGQSALVRTLKNAIESGRIAHAFMLTGVRGVGKTTTARIIAKSLNYTGKDGKAGPTIGDTSDCEIAQAIASGRHPDVIEMDAASHTGVDDIRDIIDSVNYAPTSARYKIYIIDEVHMLSKNAFNALLKTLEEPPSHVKFIFATTEIRKVPITVLSRCQRFDLRRVEVGELNTHFKSICDQEKVDFDEEAVIMIARAADGSVRDGLSILDQAIALSDDKITVDIVKDMLGLADGSRILDLFDKTLSGNAEDALDILSALHSDGADPVTVIEDLLALTHSLTKMKISKGNAKAAGLPQGEEARITELSFGLSMPALNKSWQILMKGLGEVNAAPMPQSALEMVIIRLIYAHDLPDPLDLIKKINKGEVVNSASTAPQTTGDTTPPPGATVNTASHLKVHKGGAVAQAKPQENIEAVAQSETQPQSQTDLQKSPETLRDIYDLLLERKEVRLAGEVYNMVHLVSMKAGRIELRVNENAPADFSQRFSKKLLEITNERWMISLSNHSDALTLAEEDLAIKNQRIENAKQNPVVKEIFSAFPGAEIIEVLTNSD